MQQTQAAQTPQSPPPEKKRPRWKIGALALGGFMATRLVRRYRRNSAARQKQQQHARQAHELAKGVLKEKDRRQIERLERAARGQ